MLVGNKCCNEHMIDKCVLNLLNETNNNHLHTLYLQAYMEFGDTGCYVIV